MQLAHLLTPSPVFVPRPGNEPHHVGLANNSVSFRGGDQIGSSHEMQPRSRGPLGTEPAHPPAAHQPAVYARAQILAVGGIQAYLNKNPDIWFLNVSKPSAPVVIGSADPPLVRARTSPGVWLLATPTDGAAHRQAV